MYMYVSKESKQVSHNPIYFIQSHDPDAHKSWYELGQEVGLDIIDDEEEEENIQKEEEDEVRVERNKIHVLIVFLLMSKESKLAVYKINKHMV